MFSARCSPSVICGSLLLYLCVATLANAADPITHRLLAADSSKGHAMIINAAGETEWTFPIGPLHDIHYLNNGHVLLQNSWTNLVEVDPKSNKIVWEYDAARGNGNEGKPLEVHAFQRLENGNTMIAESGVSRIIEIDHDGKLQKQFPLQVKQPHPHRDTRLVRKLDNGNYLVCHEGDGIVREYSSDGKSVWEFAVPMFGEEPRPGHGPEAFGNQCFCALRFTSGNTLISTGNGHKVIEVTPNKEIVWQLTEADLTGIDLAWITTLQVLPNEHIVLVNCHAGPKNPQVIEVDRDKNVVWTFHDFERFGNALTNVVVLPASSK